MELKPKMMAAEAAIILLLFPLADPAAAVEDVTGATHPAQVLA